VKKERIDSRQLSFGPEGDLKVPYRAVFEIHSRVVSCPYCLYEDKVAAFLTVPKKHGEISEKRARCPDCKVLMLTRTLTAEMTVEAYAEWVCVMASYDRNDRISWVKIKARLKQMGITEQFWEAYKKVRAEIRAQKPSQEYEAQWQAWEKEQKEKEAV